jgi:uncharacterized paraquat-inducible protein A
MQCARCSTGNPDAAQYCHRCGAALRGPDAADRRRGQAYAVQPGEGVHQFALVSTVMPHTNRRVADHYRWAFLAGAAIVLVFSMAGLLAAAVLGAAFLVPVVYVLYLYDVNLWEDSPLPVVLVLFLFTGLGSLLVSLVWFQLAFKDQLISLFRSVNTPGGVGSMPFGAFLLFAVVLPIVATAVMVVGPVFLASRATFDDMIDGFTFGVAAGTAYAAFETVVAFAAVFQAVHVHTSDGLGSWLVIILNLMVVKSLIYGTGAGIAVASFSGKGEGYDGFTPPFFSNLAFAAAANVLYWVGVRLFAYADFGQALSLLWGVVILAALVIRTRTMLQTALLEAALEDAANQRRHKAATTDSGFCPECEMPLLPDSMFCVACGSSVRATSSMARRHIREQVTAGRAR